MNNYIERITLRNGTVMINLLDYCGDDDFYAMYQVILDVLSPDQPTYGVDSMCIDGSFRKDGLLVRMSSESAYDQCCFVYDPTSMTEEEATRVEGWIAAVVTELRSRLPR